ncbi:MAG: DUF748 domain-containing protein [Pseudomonadales bacterium]|jgi:hypothetical protein|nr:DUF748 domain-containing protein [Pseudomonadales bacterium]
MSGTKGADPRPSRGPGRLLRAGVAGLVAWALFGYLAVPWLVHRYLPPQVAAALDARLDLGDVAFDPFLFRLKLLDLRLTGPLSAPGFERATPLTLASATIDLSVASLLTLHPAIEIDLDAPALAVERDPQGRLNWAALVPPAATPTPAEPAEPAPLPGITLSLRIAGGSVDYIDQTRPGIFRTRVDALAFGLEGLRLDRGEAAPLTLAGALETDTAFSADARLSMDPSLHLEVDLNALPLEIADRWLADTTPLRDLSGHLSAAILFRLGSDGAMALDRSSLTLDDLFLRIASPEAPTLRIGRLEVADLQGPLTPLDLQIGRLEIDRPQLTAQRPPPGVPTAETSAAGAPAAGSPAAGSPAAGTPAAGDPVATVDAAPPTGSPAPPAAAEAEPLRVLVTRTTIDGLSVQLTDAALPAPAVFVIDEGRIELGALPALGAREADPPTPLAVGLRLADSGRLSVDGAFRLEPLSSTARIRLDALALEAFAPWVDAYSGLGLRAGQLDVDAQVDASLDPDREPSATVSADLALSAFELLDPGGVRLLAFESLGLEALHADLATQTIRLDALGLHAPEIRFARAKDGRTNLSAIGPRPTMAAGGTDRSGEAPPPEAADGSPVPDAPDLEDAAPWTWSLAKLTVDGGTLDFVDEALILPFATTVEALGGSAADLSSDANTPATLLLEGRIPPNGTARIEARLVPSDPFKRSDIDIRFAQVPMPRLSPYVATFAGRQVAGGRLDLDLSYGIEAGALQAENKAVFNAFRLGPRVDAPDAMDLPLDLALALLRDPDDRIRLDVPVSGSLDDPEFDLGPVIGAAIRRVLTNLVTAPFRLLAGLVGAGEVPIDELEFAFGDAEVPEDQLERLVALEGALLQRPALTLVLGPAHAGEADAGALRVRQLQERLEARMAETGEARSEALRALYGETFSPEALTALVNQYESADAASATFETEITGQLLARTRLAEGALEALARARAEAIADQLRAAGLPDERIRIGTEIRVDDSGETAAVFAFDLTAG